jgi:lipoprotein NlpI
MKMNNIRLNNIRLKGILLKLSVASILSASPALATFSNDSVAEKLYREGCHLMQARRYQEAIDKYKEAVELDTHFVAALVNLSYSYNHINQYDQSIEAATKAIANNNESSYAYEDRAYAYYELAQFDKALADYKAASQYDPQNSEYYYECGICLSGLEDYSEAIQYYDISLKHGSKNILNYYMRGLANLFLNNNAQAVTDLKKHRSLVNLKETHQRYDLIFCSIALKRLGEDKEAQQLLVNYEKELPKDKWPYPVIQYLAGQISADNLLAEAKNNNQLTEANAYIGANLSAQGKKAEAKKNLLWVKEHGNHVFSEYQLAISELKKL